MLLAASANTAWSGGTWSKNVTACSAHQRLAAHFTMKGKPGLLNCDAVVYRYPHAMVCWTRCSQIDHINSFSKTVRKHLLRVTVTACALQINSGVKTTSIQVHAWHESEADVLNMEIFSNSSATSTLTPVGAKESWMVSIFS